MGDKKTDARLAWKKIADQIAPLKQPLIVFIEMEPETPPACAWDGDGFTISFLPLSTHER